ncbi:serine/threonine protein kinase [Nonomuraea sp. FMUSA5-5]|uniref:Serine/threonine protein kinase n=1 Tax=Nonomuraea composti TaxID=2720023 RepID=A0ABX1ARG4_9ACTN|nr:serine/threonine-protein kinase [Nonomuraea sp. FMUSA5-5]NJP88208.1 serine/threonine protein kinase [Nonomuraea sp. FMUSA5-5]
MARGASELPPGVRPLTVGDPAVIGRYPLLGRLGTGGMGVVYLAEHPQGDLVALKTPQAVHLHDATLRARFAEEVAFSRRILPFCTAAVVEDGTDGDRPYLVTEYLPGPALSQVVAATGPLPPRLAHGVALGAAAALVAVHEAGLVHRDLKPGNVLLSPSGPRVIDFGIARDVDTLAAHTQAGQVMGSPGWVAPERLTGGAALPPSDVFAWGCLVAFAATGRHPFGDGEPDVLTRRILFDPPSIEGVPALLRAAVSAALAKNPADRPWAADLLRALLAAAGAGSPRELRPAVEEVLGEIWRPVPYPAGGGLARLVRTEEAAGRGRGKGRRRRAEGRGDGAAGARAKGRARSPARSRAQLSQASFAALATVSIAAITVVAASGGDGPSGGSLLPGDPSVVRSSSSAAVSAARPSAVIRGNAPPVRLATRTARPTVFVTRTRTKGPVVVLTPSGERRGTSRVTESSGPGGGEGCVTPAGRRRGNAAGLDCPRPTGTISPIPQDGPGESPIPSGTPSDTPATTGTATP